MAGIKMSNILEGNKGKCLEAPEMLPPLLHLKLLECLWVVFYAVGIKFISFQKILKTKQKTKI